MRLPSTGPAPVGRRERPPLGTGKHHLVLFSYNNSASSRATFSSTIFTKANVKEQRLLYVALAVFNELLGSPSIFVNKALFPGEHLQRLVAFSNSVIH
ncbi:hypothetical protein TYRP_005512 [Tyrophagus putrescentiae]|nr:hypothetical protein TYRP_005512 [Tyrophagus putrescentiae]